MSLATNKDSNVGLGDRIMFGVYGDLSAHYRYLMSARIESRWMYPEAPLGYSDGVNY